MFDCIHVKNITLKHPTNERSDEIKNALQKCNKPSKSNEVGASRREGIINVIDESIVRSLDYRQDPHEFGPRERRLSLIVTNSIKNLISKLDAPHCDLQ